MSPETLVIDRRFKGVGRLKLACGSTKATVKRKIDRMLTALADDGRLDLLRAARDHQISLAELHFAYQRGALDTLAIGDTAQPLIQAMRDWIEHDTSGSEKHAQSRETSVRYLERLRPEAKIAEIPEMLMELRKTLGKKHARSFNVLRSNAGAFVRQQFMRNHPLYQRVIAVELLPEKPQKKHHPLELAELRAHFPAPATDPVDAIAWGMATTGMGAQEYWGTWRVLSDRVHIAGTKTANQRIDTRVRDVPLIMAPAVPTMHRRTFEDKLRERTKRAITPYDLRRTYGHALETAKIMRSRRKMYMGHGVGDTTGLYEQHEVDAFLAADGETMRAHFGIQEGPALRLHKRGSR